MVVFVRLSCIGIDLTNYCTKHSLGDLAIACRTRLRKVVGKSFIENYKMWLTRI